ncbi:MAG: hypothetical protein ACKOTE_19130, partial [Opitutaceae bacterium]
MLTRLLALALAIAASSPAARVELVAGGSEDRTGIPAVRAALREPFGAEFDAAGNLYIAEMVSGNRLLRIDPRGLLTHVAGDGVAGDAGDSGPALAARFNGPHNLAVLPEGDVLLGDTWNGRVRRYHAASGTVSSLPGFNAPPPAARTNGPYCITLTPDGRELVIADLRRVQVLTLASGRVRVVAGNGTQGEPADGAEAVD